VNFSPRAQLLDL